MGIFDLKHLENVETIPAELTYQYLGLSILLGLALMILAVWSSKKIGSRLGSKYGAIKNSGKVETAPATFSELIMGASNVLFICFGMTGIMLLVSNNLARAFAIGAAIAVIRFRVKFDGKGTGSTLFFGVLVGMACGVGQTQTAVLITVAYGVLHSIIILLMSLDKPTIEQNTNLTNITSINTGTDSH